jgi:hypothetical protein
MFATRDVVDWTRSYRTIYGISFDADYTPEEKAAAHTMVCKARTPVHIVITDTGLYEFEPPKWLYPMFHRIVMGEGSLFDSSENGAVYQAKVGGPCVPIAPAEHSVQLFVPGGDVVSTVRGAPSGYITGTGLVLPSMPIAVQIVVDGRVEETIFEVGHSLFAHSAVRLHGITYGVHKCRLMDDRGSVVDNHALSGSAYVYWSNSAQRLVMFDVQQVRLYRPLHVRFAWVAACVIQ